MPRTRQPVEHTERECEAPDCTETFTPVRSTARFHSKTCAQRAARARKAAEREAGEETSSAKAAEHTLVKSVRKALTDAGVIDAWQGQAALQTAKNAVAEGKSDAALDKLEARMMTALAAAKSADDGAPAAPPPAPEDAVARARRRRDEAAAAAAADLAAADQAEGGIET